MTSLSALLYAEATLKLLLRSGALSLDDVLEIADELDVDAERDVDEADEYRDAAHQLRCTLFDIDPPGPVVPASEHRAQFLRKQMVERTAILAKRDKPLTESLPRR